MTTIQPFNFQRAQARHNAAVVLDSAIYPGPTVTVSVKPIMSTNSTVDFTVTANLTINQFHRLVDQTLRDGRAFAGTPMPPNDYSFELVLAGREPARYVNYIWLENPEVWENRFASEFAPAIIAECQYPMSDFSDNSFYLRFVPNVVDEPLEEGEIYEPYQQTVTIDLTQDDDIENNADYAMTMDELDTSSIQDTDDSYPDNMV